jgi:hypothetical protein
MKVEVMVSHLQNEEGVYRAGEIIDLPPEMVARLGNSVRPVNEPEVMEPPAAAPAEPEVISEAPVKRGKGKK